jgi:hypothetical protein
MGEVNLPHIEVMFKENLADDRRSQEGRPVKSER